MTREVGCWEQWSHVALPSTEGTTTKDEAKCLASKAAAPDVSQPLTEPGAMMITRLSGRSAGQVVQKSSSRSFSACSQRAVSALLWTLVQAVEASARGYRHE